MKKIKYPILFLVLTCCFIFFYYDEVESNKIKVSITNASQVKKDDIESENTSNESLLISESTSVDVEKVEHVDKETIAPMTMTDQFNGTISLDVRSYLNIEVGTLVDIETPYGTYESVVDDVYMDGKAFVTTFQGTNHSEGIIIHHPESGKSFFSISSEHMEFDSDLDSNGVGTFYNVMEFRKLGNIADANDTITIEK